MKRHSLRHDRDIAPGYVFIVTGEDLPKDLCLVCSVNACVIQSGHLLESQIIHTASEHTQDYDTHILHKLSVNKLMSKYIS